MIKYEHAPDIKQQILHVAKGIGVNHNFDRVICMRSRGSKARYTIARCYSMPRVMQKAFGMKAHYIIEVIGEKFDGMSEEEKVKTLIHELLHIPKSFGGGLKGHGHVNKKAIDRLYRDYMENCRK
ncbi:MAG: metallopeptidase [Candidatus Aenigmarchaeota archaeon]|nr:metallopeptidase [Candidatus Aenigmarchaeota archaeon]